MGWGGDPGPRCLRRSRSTTFARSCPVRSVQTMNRATVFALLLVGSALAADPPRLGPPLRVDRDNCDIAKPGEQHVSEMYSILYNSWLRHASPENAALASR